MKKRWLCSHLIGFSAMSIFTVDPETLLFLLNSLPIALHGFVPPHFMVGISTLIYGIVIYMKIKKRKKNGE